MNILGMSLFDALINSIVLLVILFFCFPVLIRLLFFNAFCGYFEARRDENKNNKEKDK